MREKIFGAIVTILTLVCEVAGTVLVFSSEDATIAVKFLFWGLGTLAALIMWIGVMMFMVFIFGGEE